MASTQRSPRRRSARLAFDEEDAGPAKRARVDDASTTTGPPKQQPNGRKPAAASSKKTTASYDEDADGFQFSRAPKSKKVPPKRRSSVKATTVKEPPSDNAAEPKAAPAPRGRKTRDSQNTSSPDESAHHSKRRSARLSGDKVPNEAAQQQQAAAPVGQTAEVEGERGRARTPASNQVRVEKKRGPTMIALPFADTPVIVRNKEMRKHSGESYRRSSSQMRGRRASSLMDSGTSNALPHSEVEAADFYKHIHQDLSEPRRMKQLLIWCGTRALPERPSGSAEDINAILAARVIQDELLREFSNKSEMSDWFNREDIAPAALIKKPNPRNIQNAAKLRELEVEVKRLQGEKANWDALLGSLSSSLDKERSEIKPEPAVEAEASSIDTSLLCPSDQAALSDLQSHRDTLASTISRLQTATQPFEFKVDSFADGVHKVEMFKETSDELVGRILSESVQLLADRDKAALESAGTDRVAVGDLLKSLSRAA